MRAAEGSAESRLTLQVSQRHRGQDVEGVHVDFGVRVGVALDVALEPVLVEDPVRVVEEHADLLLGGGLWRGRPALVPGVRAAPERGVSKVEEPLVDGDLGAEVFEGVAGEVDGGGPLVLLEDSDILVREHGPVLDGLLELDDVEDFECAEELDEPADVLDHGRAKTLGGADFGGVQLDLVVREPGLRAYGREVADVGVEGALADGHEQRLGEGEVVLLSGELKGFGGTLLCVWAWRQKDRCARLVHGLGGRVLHVLGFGQVRVFRGLKKTRIKKKTVHKNKKKAKTRRLN